MVRVTLHHSDALTQRLRAKGFILRRSDRKNPIWGKVPGCPQLLDNMERICIRSNGRERLKRWQHHITYGSPRPYKCAHKSLVRIRQNQTLPRYNPLKTILKYGVMER